MPVIVRSARRRHASPYRKRFSLGVREMFALQPRLEHPRGRRALRVLEHPRFRAAYDLLLLRAEFGLAPQEMATVVDAPAGGVGRGTRPHGRRARRCDACSTRAAAPHPQPPPPLRSSPVGLTRRLCRSGSPLTSVWAATLPIRHEQVREGVRAPGGSAAHARVAVSPLYGSRPLGPVAQPDFVNAAVGLLTQLSSGELLEQLRALETAFGRPRERRALGTAGASTWICCRTLSEQRADTHLTLPHPGIVERNFVLYPLGDIAPDLELPGLGRVTELKGRVTSEGLSLL